MFTYMKKDFAFDFFLFSHVKSFFIVYSLWFGVGVYFSRSCCYLLCFISSRKIKKEKKTPDRRERESRFIPPAGIY